MQQVLLPLVRIQHGARLRLDRDAALALHVELVEDLAAVGVVGRDGARVLEEAVGQGGLAVVDVRDDAEVAVAREGDGVDAGLEGGGLGVEGGADVLVAMVVAALGEGGGFGVRSGGSWREEGEGGGEVAAGVGGGRGGATGEGERGKGWPWASQRRAKPWSHEDVETRRAAHPIGPGRA